jgi:ferric-dicitrate binding protein FerR (iron transport regulator)
MKLSILALSFLFALNVSAAGFLPNATIVKIKGKAQVNKASGKEGTEVTKGMTIAIPEKGDYVIVKFQNGHKVKLSEATVKVEELTEKKTLLNLTKGQVYVSAQKLTPDETFKVKTKYASFGIRGTKFTVSINEKRKKVYLCVTEGVVHAAQGKASADIKKDEDLWIGLSTRSFEVNPATTAMLDMTNKAIDELDKI